MHTDNEAALSASGCELPTMEGRMRRHPRPSASRSVSQPQRQTHLTKSAMMEGEVWMDVLDVPSLLCYNVASLQHTCSKESC